MADLSQADPKTRPDIRRISSGWRNVVWMEPVFDALVIGCKLAPTSALPLIGRWRKRKRFRVQRFRVLATDLAAIKTQSLINILYIEKLQEYLRRLRLHCHPQEKPVHGPPPRFGSLALKGGVIWQNSPIVVTHFSLLTYSIISLDTTHIYKWRLSSLPLSIRL